MMQIQVDIQRASDTFDYPTDEDIESWTRYTLQHESDQPEPFQLGVRLVDAAESTELNQSYRGKEGPTNVLSFPFEPPPGYPEPISHRLLGDIVICVPIVTQEAMEQQKNLLSHWAHLVTHGVLHLLGYDHHNDQAAEQMEALEIELLSHFKIKNPYQ